MSDAPPRRRRSKVKKRRIVEATLQPGASTALVATTPAVDANQVFQWRKLYREARMEAESD